ncbi:MAG: DUF1538 domain-containing protein [Acholeplasmataceae bacterium]|nr:DUF1538 domain-containing protein [Acholeplasmataceae bacterium]
MYLLKEKFRENLTSVLPITIVVIFLHFTLVPLSNPQLFRFLLGSLLVIIGLTLFLIGVDLGITPLGGHTGMSFTKTNKLWIVIVAGLILGFFISIAEPGLLVFANQVEEVTTGLITSWSIVIFVSIGLAIFIGIGFLRIIFNWPLYKILLIVYAIILVMALFATPDFLAISFDASGATTGALAVPFILAISTGISRRKKDSKSSEKDSFGLVAIASAGAIISLLCLNYFNKDLQFASEINISFIESNSIVRPFVDILPKTIIDSFIALLPLIVILFVMQFASFKLKKRAFRRMVIGFVYAFVGLVIFLLGVNAGFMEVGNMIGSTLAVSDQKIYILIFAFILGLLTIIAEPAVSVLTHQIEDITAGYIKRRAVLIPLSIGVGLSILLSITRILVDRIELWHYLLPGYLIALALMFIVPKLFVGIAFDAGGVATGPLTATFILAFTQGAANAYEGANVVIDGFGMIAMVALAPIITLQLLGLVYKIKTRKGGV